MDDQDLVTIPHQYEYEGMVMNKHHYPPEHLDRCRKLQLHAGDIACISYPRTGTTLTTQMISLILCEDEEAMKQKANVPLDDRFVHMERLEYPDDDPVAKLDKLSPRLLKSHLPYGLLKNWFDSEAKIVVVLRNPKDALVSMFHFYMMLAELGFCKESWEKLFVTYQKNKMYNGDAIEYFAELWHEKDRPNVCTVFYEDIVKNPVPQIQMLAAFLGKSITDGQVELIADLCSFKAMKENEATNYADPDVIREYEFVRKGQIGEWKKFFTVAQNEWMDERIATMLDPIGLQFKYQ